MIGFAFAAYLLYLGSMTQMRVPAGKAAGYTAVVVVIWIVLYMIVSGIIIGAVAAAMIGGAAMGGAFLR